MDERTNNCCISVFLGWWGNQVLLRHGALASLLFVLLSVHQLGGDLPLVSGGVVLVGVLSDLQLGPLLTRAPAVHGLVLVVVVVLVLVEVALGHLDVVVCSSSLAKVSIVNDCGAKCAVLDYAFFLL